MADHPTRRVVRGPAIGAYSSAVVAGDTCYVAGQAALDADGRPRTDLGVAGQTEVTSRTWRRCSPRQASRSPTWSR